MTTAVPWWKQGVIYQIYPRSFADASGDGIGDLQGIISHLDYLRWLGVDALWLSPIFPSPMADFGYDVADHTGIHPMFGTLEDFDALVAAAGERGLRVILDYVPNHTSDQHPWFLESRSSREDPRRDWYIWADPAPGGGPPNNWLSRFTGGPGWTWDETTGQYYLHTFLPAQPDLNWRNPEVRQAMTDVLRFWMDRGVAGFRADVVYRILKDPDLRDNPRDPDWREGMAPHAAVLQTYTRDIAEVHEPIKLLRATVDAYPDRLLIGEVNLDVEGLVAYYGDDDELHLPLNFHPLVNGPWDAASVRALIERYETALPAHAWPNWVFSNHDESRFASRVGRARARAGMLFLLTVRGTPVLYYGEEIGMVDVPVPPDRVQDPWERHVPGLGLGRDPERTPMQWDDGPNAGFCAPDVEPWLPLAEDYREVNVACQAQDPRSMLSLTRELLTLRRSEPALRTGSLRVLVAPEDVLAYLRESDGRQVLVLLNFGGAERSVILPRELRDLPDLSVRLSSLLDRSGEPVDAAVTLRPHEAVVCC